MAVMPGSTGWGPEEWPRIKYRGLGHSHLVFPGTYLQCLSSADVVQSPGDLRLPGALPPSPCCEGFLGEGQLGCLHLSQECKTLRLPQLPPGRIKSIPHQHGWGGVQTFLKKGAF